MASMAVDTLTIARELKAAEVPAVQAEAIASAIGRSVVEGAATKQDIDVVLQRMEAMEQRLKADAAVSRASLLTWIVGALFAATGVIIAVLKIG